VGREGPGRDDRAARGRDGRELERRPLVATTGARIDNGYLCFERFLPVERPLVAELEARFLSRAIEAFDLSPRLLYDDQYLCSAGQLFLVATGRYRMLADLRGWLARTRGIDNFTSKPYDLATLLIWREAGIPCSTTSSRLSTRRSTPRPASRSSPLRTRSCATSCSPSCRPSWPRSDRGPAPGARPHRRPRSAPRGTKHFLNRS
jgi:hypothetical protein